MLEKIERMIADLLPIVDGKPDMSGDEPDIAQLVLQAQDKAELQPFFNERTDAEGWREIAVLLAKALLTIDKEHRAIIKAIRSA